MRKQLLLAAVLLARAAHADDPDLPEAPKKPSEPLRPHVVVGLRGGPVLAGGDLVDGARAKFGAGFGLDAGVRLMRHVYGGLAIDMMMFSTHEKLAVTVQDNIVGFGMGPMVGWYTRPETLGAVLQLGIGGRLFAVSNQTGRGDSYGSFEGRAMIGMTFPVGALRLVLPRLDFVGGASDSKIPGTGALAHAVLTLGISAAYEHDLSKKTRD